jgi:hypothetical protein
MQCDGLEATDFDYNLATTWRPDAKMNTAPWLRLGTDWQAPGGSGRNRTF